MNGVILEAPPVPALVNWTEELSSRFHGIGCVGSYVTMVATMLMAPRLVLPLLMRVLGQ